MRHPDAPVRDGMYACRPSMRDISNLISESHVILSVTGGIFLAVGRFALLRPYKISTSAVYGYISKECSCYYGTVRSPLCRSPSTCDVVVCGCGCVVSGCTHVRMQTGTVHMGGVRRAWISRPGSTGWWLVVVAIDVCRTVHCGEDGRCAAYSRDRPPQPAGGRLCPGTGAYPVSVLCGRDCVCLCVRARCTCLCVRRRRAQASRGRRAGVVLASRRADLMPPAEAGEGVRWGYPVSGTGPVQLYCRVSELGHADP